MRMQAADAIALIVVEGVAPEVVARKCGFEAPPKPARPGFAWGLEDESDEMSSFHTFLFGGSARRPAPLGDFTNWLQKQLGEIIAEGAASGQIKNSEEPTC
jgi:hypothetical protein